MSTSSVVVGIDVAKAHVDVSVLGAKFDARRFDNQAEADSAFAAASGPLEVALADRPAVLAVTGFSWRSMLDHRIVVAVWQDLLW